MGQKYGSVFNRDQICCDTAMNQDYTDIIQRLSQLLDQAIVEREVNLSDGVKQLDGEVAKLLRLLGLQVMSMLLNKLAQKLTQEAKKTGFVIHRSLKATYSVIFGIVEVSSPYLWNKRERRGSRPVKEKLGIEHGERSITVKRALNEELGSSTNKHSDTTDPCYYSCYNFHVRIFSRFGKINIKKINN